MAKMEELFDKEKLERWEKEDRRRRLEETVERGLWYALLGSGSCSMIWAVIGTCILLLTLCFLFGVVFPVSIWEVLRLY